MRVFVNNISGVRWYALDDAVTEERDAWYIPHARVSLPKAEWREQHEQEERKHTAQQGEGADHA